MRYSASTRVLIMLSLLVLVVPASLAGKSPGRVIDRYFGAYKAASVEAMLTLYSPDAVFEDVNQRHHFEGTEEIGALLGQIVAMHHTMEVRERRRVVDRDVVVVEYDYIGTLNGAALGQIVGKEGCPDLEYTLPTTSWYRVKNGKIVHQRDFIDWATFQELRQKLLAARG